MAIVSTLFSKRRIRKPAALTTLVSVGNAKQPFRRLLEAVREVGNELPAPVIVQYGHTEFSDDRFRCVDFLSMDEYQDLVKDADVIIVHAGAGSVINAIRSGTIPIVMPRRVEFAEHVDDHQIEFTDELLKLNKVIVANNTSELRVAVDEVKKHKVSGVQEKHEIEMVSLIRQAIAEFVS